MQTNLVSLQTFLRHDAEEKSIDARTFEYFERQNLHAERKGLTIFDDMSECFRLELGNF